MDMREYLKSGRQAIRLLYFLVVGLGITKTISLLFEGKTDPTKIPLESWLMFVVYLSFVGRYFLGAYGVLSYDIEMEVRRPKITADILGFSFQALIFYAWAVNFSDRVFSESLIVTLCTVDVLWILSLFIAYGIRESTTRVWIGLNVGVVAFVGLDLWFGWGVMYLLAVSLLFALVDFVVNRDFYFPMAEKVGLRIFLAGPYTDDEPPEKIAENIAKATEVGKCLALKGHYPFIPQTMLHGWERDKRFTVELFKEIDFAWLDFCDALYFISESPGANVERELARKKGLQLFDNLEQVPDVRNPRAAKI